MRITFTLVVVFVFLGLCVRSQLIFTIAGNGTAGYGGDNGPAKAALLRTPDGVAVDRYNNIFIGDYGNSRVRKINALTDTIVTVVGNGVDGDAGEGGLATNAEIDRPNDVALDTLTNIYVVDDDKERILKVTVPGDTVRSIAGTGTPGYNGDNIPATTAQFDGSYGVSVDYQGNVYIADYWNHRIRKVTAATGIITTFAGTGTGGYNGDNIAATSAELYNPYGVLADTAGNVYIADRSNNRVRKVDKQGIIHTIAGNGTASFNGDGIATTSEISGPTGVGMDAAGNIYIADLGNNRVRRLTVATGMLTTIAGTGVAGYNGDSIPATTAELNAPARIALDSYGNIYISEFNGNRVRKIVVNDTASISITSSAVSICAGTPVTFTSMIVNGGLQPAYQWKVNGATMGGDSVTFTTWALQNYDTVVCVLTSNQPGVIGSPATSNQVIVSVTTPDTASIIIVPSASTICTGTTVNFAATGSNGGTAPVYQWFVNDTLVGGDSAAFSSSNLINGDTVFCIFTSNASCVTGSPALSNPVIITVNPIDTASVSITPSATNICPGTTVNFSANPSLSGNLNSFQWQVNGAAEGSDTSAFSSSTLHNGDTVICILTSGASCVTGSPATSNAIIINVGTGYNAGNMVASLNPVCAGTPATITVHGSTGALQWQSSITGNNFTGILNAVDSVYSWNATATTYFRIIAGSGNCADTSRPYEFMVHPLPTPAVPVASDSIFCSSDSALLTEPGSYTLYQWSDGDTRNHTYVKTSGGYWVTVTDANGCTAVSPHRRISIYPVSSVSITLRGDTLSTMPAVSYQWLLNGYTLAGDTSQSYIARQAGTYTVQVTDTNGCPLLSSTVDVNISGVNDLLLKNGLNVYPNPFNGSIYIEVSDASLHINRMEIFDVLGREAFAQENNSSQNPLLIDVPVLPKGVYVLQISTTEGSYTQRVVRQ